MRVRLKYLVLHTDRAVAETGTNLRGYIGNRFSHYPVLHHHAEKPILAYPMVQYRVIGGTPSILGIGEAAGVVGEIADEIEELVFLSNRYHVEQKVMYDRTVPLTGTDTPVRYRFISPWLSLNQENYRKYLQIYDWKSRKQFLNRILVGNVLSMAKGLSVMVEHRLFVRTELEKVPVRYKGVEMTGFTGTLLVNMQIPDFIGIGKGVSQGFGTIRRVPERHDMVRAEREPDCLSGIK